VNFQPIAASTRFLRPAFRLNNNNAVDKADDKKRSGRRIGLQNKRGQGIFDIFLDAAAHGAGSVFGVYAFFKDVFARFFGQFKAGSRVQQQAGGLNRQSAYQE